MSLFTSQFMEYLEHLGLGTPSLLFSAISLILLAYTNRFLSYASVVRNLKERYENDPENDPTSIAQIHNLVLRLKLTRWMQMLGALSLLFCISAMFFLYIKIDLVAHIIFGLGMLALAASLIICIWEIEISTDAINLHLHSIRQRLTEKDNFRNSSFRRKANRREGESQGEQKSRENRERQLKEQKERNKDKEHQQGQRNKNERKERPQRADEQERGQRPERQQPQPTKQEQSKEEPQKSTPAPQRQQEGDALPSASTPTEGQRSRHRNHRRARLQERIEQNTSANTAEPQNPSIPITPAPAPQHLATQEPIAE